MMNKKILSYFVVFLFCVAPALASTWFTNASNFDEGTYNQTFLNGTFIQLNAASSSGDYISKVFDSQSVNGIVTWNNISWYQELNYGAELPNYKGIDSGSFVDVVDMTDNVGLWHLDESSGTIVDTSGEGNNGTYNGALYSQEGKFNTAIGFDGSDDIINTSYVTNNLINGFTVSFWINPNDLSGSYMFLGRYDDSYPDERFYFGTSSSNLFVGVGNNYNSSFEHNMVASRWYHILVTYDNVTVTCYVNGIDKGSFNAEWTTINSSFPIHIGARNFPTSPLFFNGTIDEVAIWNRTLTSNEIENVYKRGILKLNLTARSCDDSACSGETWTDYNDVSPQTLSEPDNRYFQYKFHFETEDTSFSPQLYNVTVEYTINDTVPPALSNINATPTDTSAEITWITDELSNSSVNYGTNASNLNLSAGQDDSVTNHSVILTGLDENTTYYYTVTSCDIYGNCNTSSIYNFTTTAVQYPVISNITAISIDANNEKIEWITDITSDSNVSYGLTPSLGLNVYDGSLVTSHSITLTGLTSNTLYYYNITSCYGSGCTTNGTFNFTTVPISISNVNATNINQTSATIVWDTNGLANSTLEYGLSDSSLNNTISSGSLVTSHSFQISGLSPETIYFYRVKSCDNGSCDTSAIYNFTTAAYPPNITIISPVPKVYTNSMRIPLTVNTTADVCWYSIDGGENVTFDCTETIYLDFIYDQSYTLTVYGYKTTTGLTGSDSVTFTITTDLSAGKGFIVTGVFIGFILISLFLIAGSSFFFRGYTPLRILFWFMGYIFIIISLSLGRVAAETFIRVPEMITVMNTAHNISIWVLIFVFMFMIIAIIYNIILGSKEKGKLGEDNENF